MPKGITVADAYAFELSDELKALAETELRETSATRDFALTALREWIESNPRIAAARLGKFEWTTFFFSREHIRSIVSLLVPLARRCQFFVAISSREKVQRTNDTSQHRAISFVETIVRFFQ